MEVDHGAGMPELRQVKRTKVPDSRKHAHSKSQCAGGLLPKTGLRTGFFASKFNHNLLQSNSKERSCERAIQVVGP